MSLSNDMYPLVDRQTDNYNYTYMTITSVDSCKTSHGV